MPSNIAAATRGAAPPSSLIRITKRVERSTSVATCEVVEPLWTSASQCPKSGVALNFRRSPPSPRCNGPHNCIAEVHSVALDCHLHRLEQRRFRRRQHIQKVLTDEATSLVGQDLDLDVLHVLRLE